MRHTIRAIVTLFILATAILVVPMLASAETTPSPAVGDAAPDLLLLDQDGEEVRLGELWAEGPVVIYFYPKDFTPGCTAQACSLRDANDDLRDAGISVVGISADTVESHRKFAEKHRLSFTLLADPDGVAAGAYGVRASFLGATVARRVTFLVDVGGKVARVWDPALPQGHAETVLAGAKELGLTEPASAPADDATTP